MKSFIFSVVVVAIVSSTASAQNPVRSKTARLNEELSNIPVMDKALSEMRPLLQDHDHNESDAHFIARVEKVIKARALIVHYLHQNIETGLEIKWTFEDWRKEEKSPESIKVIDKVLADKRLTTLEDKAEKLAKLAGVELKGLALIGRLDPEDLNDRLRIINYRKSFDEAFKAYMGVQP